MRKGAMTAKEIEWLKPGERRQEIAVGKPNGLYLSVHPSGKKSWILRFRHEGRPRGLTFEKAFPELSLAGARARAESALATLRTGVDPAVTVAEEQRSPEAFS